MMLELAKKRLIDDFERRAKKKVTLLVGKVADHELSFEEAARRLAEG